MINFLIIIVIIIVILTILIYNRIKRLSNKVKQAESTIDVYLNQRFDLIPNLVECVKAYAKHENDLLTSITALREGYNNSKELKEGAKLNNKCGELLFLSEKYPNLKSNETFLNLQNNITKMENELQAARRLYNSDVTMYNNYINTFPGNIYAQIFGFKEQELFEIDELKKINIDVNFKGVLDE